MILLHSVMVAVLAKKGELMGEFMTSEKLHLNAAAGMVSSHAFLVPVQVDRDMER